MAIGLAQQRSILARVEKLRRENPVLLALIEQAQGFAFPEITSPSRSGERPRVSFRPKIQSRPVARSGVAFPGWSISSEGEKAKKRRVVLRLKLSQPWRRQFNIMLMPTMMMRLNKKKRDEIFGGGVAPLTGDVVFQVLPEGLRITEGGEPRITEDGEERVTEDG